MSISIKVPLGTLAPTAVDILQATNWTPIFSNSPIDMPAVCHVQHVLPQIIQD